MTEERRDDPVRTPAELSAAARAIVRIRATLGSMPILRRSVSGKTALPPRALGCGDNRALRKSPTCGVRSASWSASSSPVARGSGVWLSH